MAVDAHRLVRCRQCGSRARSLRAGRARWRSAASCAGGSSPRRSRAPVRASRAEGAARSRAGRTPLYHCPSRTGCLAGCLQFSCASIYAERRRATVSSLLTPQSEIPVITIRRWDSDVTLLEVPVDTLVGASLPRQVLLYADLRRADLRDADLRAADL